MTLLSRAAIGAVLTMVAGGSGAVAASPRATDDSAAVAPAGVRAAPELIDVAALPAGRPPRVPYLAAGKVSWHHRTVETNIPDDAVYLSILGSVGGRLVVDGYRSVGPPFGDRFWAIGRSGEAQRLGLPYESYTYGPRLVASTGHLWIHNEDRTTPRTITELDAHTGRVIAAWPHNRVPSGLAPADQALVDGWVARRTVVPDLDAVTRDGSLSATVKSLNPEAGVFNDSVLVSRTSEPGVVARFSFPEGNNGGVERVVFEGKHHVLVLTTLSISRRHGYEQAIVRCSLDDGTCERATDVGGNMALGVIRPRFEPRHSRH